MLHTEKRMKPKEGYGEFLNIMKKYLTYKKTRDNIN